MSYSRKTPTMQFSKKEQLVAVVTSNIDQSMFYDLQEFLLVNFQTLKLANAYMI